MVLVPEDVFVRYEQKQKLYCANLECYLNLRQQKDNKIPMVQLAMKTSKKNEREHADLLLQEVTMLPDSAIVESILKNVSASHCNFKPTKNTT